MDKTIESIRHLLYPASSRPEVAALPCIIEAAANDRVVTFEQFERLIDSAHGGLAALGVKKNDKVMLTAPNSPELAAAIAATWRLGAVAIPVDFRMTLPEVFNVAKRISAAALVASSRVIPDFEKTLTPVTENGAKILDLCTITENSKPLASVLDSLTPEDDALVILTSGTTGIPKGAVHDLKTLVENLEDWGNLVDMNSTKKGLLPLPLSHVFGLEVTFVCVITAACVIFTDPASPKSFFACLPKFKPHVLVGVPTLYMNMLAMDPNTVGLDNAEILLSGGAPLPTSLASEFKARFGKTLNNGYGSTESKIISLNLGGPFESVGRSIARAKVEIVNDRDEVLPEGQTGEIRISGPMLMKGYLNDKEATAQVMKGDRYYTGDMGHMEDGYLFISGRTKEMIIVAGNKVFPSEVEDVLRKSPLVKEVAVLGLPHSKLGQIVKAIIVITDSEMSEKLEGSEEEKKEAKQHLVAQIKDYCKENLKRELRPMDWEFLPVQTTLPKTAIGKVDKKQLVHA
ncbi:MAG TPA: class I adenylate-forming enzyme family protein [Drouetiella sp.]|jgi:long-chain acyl-CoA synthetase